MKPGWLERQLKKASDTVASWPKHKQESLSLRRSASSGMADPCRCNCGYTCGGPGRCEVFAEDPIKCIEQHYKRDCDHDFTGPWVKFHNGGSVTCAKCGIDACSHDCMVGP